MEKNLLPVPENTKQVLRKLYNLDKPGRLDEAIDIIQNWIKKQDHLVKKDFSREYIEFTLIACKGSVEKAKKQIDSLCTMKTLMPKFFRILDSRMDTVDDSYLIPLPQLTKDLYRVIVIKINNQHFSSDIFLKYFQFCVMMAEYLKRHDYSKGFIIIEDFRDLNLFDVLAKLNIMDLQQCVTILVEGFGARMKSIHILTESKAVEMLIKMVKQFVSEKIGNRINTHATLDDIYKDIPKEIMPLEYGGNEKSVWKMYDDCIEAIGSKDHQEYLKMMYAACTDETKRHNGKFNEEYLGMPGSFRSLSVD